MVKKSLQASFLRKCHTDGKKHGYFFFLSVFFSIRVKCLHQTCPQKLLLLTCKILVGLVYGMKI